MEIERAIEILDTEHREHYESIELVKEACSMGQDALRKQIPMELDYEADGYWRGELVYDLARCRICGHEFEAGVNDWGSKFCPDCGQALKWAEE